MPKPDGDTRDLKFPLYRSLVSQTDTPNEAIQNFPFAWSSTDSDEQVFVTLKLSLNEYIALSSAIDVGSDIAYGENAILIWWTWVRSLYSMDICEAIEDCIETSPSVQAVINQTIINQGLVDPNTIDPENTTGGDRQPNSDTTSIAPPPPSCDKDALWAGIREMVERIDQNGRDVLEDMQFLNDKVEQWGELIDIVPILGDVIKDVSDLFTAQIPDLLNAYNAASSPAFLDNVACDLFEMVCNECRYPTFDEIMNYFGSLSYFSLGSFSTLTYGTLWNSIKTITGAVPESLWYSVNLWQAFTLSIGGTFKRSYGEKSFEIWASLGEDNPNDNWIVLCGGCVDVNCIEYDFTVSDHGFTVWSTGNRPFGTWVSGEGWKCTWNFVSPANDNRIYIEKINMAQSFDSADFEIEYLTNGGGGNRSAAVRLVIGTTNQFASVTQPDPYTLAPVTPEIGATVHEDNGDGIRFNVATNTPSADPDAFVLQKLRVFYTGIVAPAGGEPC